MLFERERSLLGLLSRTDCETIRKSFRYGAYSNRARACAKSAREFSEPTGHARPPEQDSDFARETRSTWARLLRRVYEVDPLLCPRCRAEMKIISIITDPRILDRIKSSNREMGEFRGPFGTATKEKASFGLACCAGV